jgi:hypothetical protein
LTNEVTMISRMSTPTYAAGRKAAVVVVACTRDVVLPPPAEAAPDPDR